MAELVADSIFQGDRVTTFLVRMHRFVLAEFNTHCIFARNSASSRAIPIEKQLAQLEKDLAWPVKWPSEKSGMQGGDELDPVQMGLAKFIWRKAAEEAVEQVKALQKTGLHKSLCNRLLEPFMWHTVAVTASSYENFFDQRDSPLAQPEIRVVAAEMRALYNVSIPRELRPGEWHLPFLLDSERPIWSGERRYVDEAIKVSVARVARTSYNTSGNSQLLADRAWEEDLKLFDRLVSADPMHASPLEHIATPAPWNSQIVEVWDPMSIGPIDSTVCVAGRMLPKIGKFKGWLQFRHLFEAQTGHESWR